MSTSCPRRAITGSSPARTVRSPPSRSTSTTRSHSSAAILRTGAGRGAIPALATTTSTPPNRSPAAAIAREIAAASVTSACSPIALSVPSRAAASATSRPSRSMSATEAPRRTSARPQARPIPRAPPVIIATRPDRLNTASATTPPPRPLPDPVRRYATHGPYPPPRPLRRLARDRQQHVGRPDHGRELLERILGHPQRELRLARLIQGLGDLLTHPPGPDGVQLDRRDGQPPAPEGHRPRPRLPELDPRLLQRDQVQKRLRRLPEAVLELLAQQHQIGHLARPGDPPVHVDLRLLVGDVVGGHVGVDVDVQAHRLPLRLPVRPVHRRRHRLVEHLHVELEAERGHVTGLLVAQQVAGAADLQVAHG